MFYQMKITKLSLLFLLCEFAVSFCVSAQYNGIKNYQKVTAWGSCNGRDVAVIRSYKSDEKTYFIVVGFDDLKTYLVSSDSISVSSSSWEYLLEKYKETPYVKALNFSKNDSMLLQDVGIKHGNPNDNGILLTIDLCPSHRVLDRNIFISIGEAFQSYGKPQPMGLSITGKFLKSHLDDIRWLKNLENSGLISIVWINHTYNHHYNPSLPVKENFLLEPNTHLDEEILRLEKELLGNEILGSVFFRFPGLVSDRSLIDSVVSYGLIPIGSDAWLAKDQPVKNGDIVLIHGNGNEPIGVKKFLNLLHAKNRDVLQHHWLLYDLRENIQQEFEEKN